jgi:hypothetical protein
MKSIVKKTSFRGDETDKEASVAAAAAAGSKATSVPPIGKLSSFRDEMAAEVRDGSITYGRQAELERLPIPTLQETLEKFPKFLEALQSHKEQQETQRVVQEFLQGPGPALQQALVDYERQGYESGEFGSYVEEFWNEAYLAPDSSVVLNLNPFFVLEGGVSTIGYGTMVESQGLSQLLLFPCSNLAA